MITNENTTNTSETTQTQANTPTKTGFAIASMVCGILALIFCCFKFISIILAIVSLSLGGVALQKQYGGRGMAISGVVCSIIALALAIILYIYQIVTGLTFASLLF